MFRPRLAFTVVELLVALVAIAILVAMMFPTVQRLRESAARTQCAHQMKQLGAAMHNYHGVHKNLPPACLTSSMYGPGPIVMLLGHLDRDLFSGVDDARDRFGVAAGLVNRDIAGAVRIPVLACPSDPHDAREYLFGWTNYHSNYGTWVGARGWDGVFGPNFDISVARKTGSLRFRDIGDGLSNTAAFAEVANGKGNNAAAQRDPRVDCFEFGALTTTEIVDARGQLLAKDWRTADFADPLWGNPPWRWRGYPWREGTIWRTGYNHLLPPNNPCWRCNNDWWQLVSPASSFHPGGVNVLMADGAVRFVADDIDPDVWAAAGSRNGEEPLAIE
jgi:prepilin-type processing-associated H-X9-DG protein